MVKYIRFFRLECIGNYFYVQFSKLNFFLCDVKLWFSSISYIKIHKTSPLSDSYQVSKLFQNKTENYTLRVVLCTTVYRMVKLETRDEGVIDENIFLPTWENDKKGGSFDSLILWMQNMLKACVGQR